MFWSRTAPTKISRQINVSARIQIRYKKFLFFCYDNTNAKFYYDLSRHDCKFKNPAGMTQRPNNILSFESFFSRKKTGLSKNGKVYQKTGKLKRKTNENLRGKKDFKKNSGSSIGCCNYIFIFSKSFLGSFLHRLSGIKRRIKRGLKGGERRGKR